MSTARKTLFLVVTFLVVLLLAASVAMGAKPKRIMIVVMDQMRPEYAKQYNMTNVLWLQNHGVNFNKAYVGDMASETVVSHNVMVSGLLPEAHGLVGRGHALVRPLTKDLLGYGRYPTGLSSRPVTCAVNQYKTTDRGLPLPEARRLPARQVPRHHRRECRCRRAYQVESMAAKNADYWVRMGSKKARPRTVPELPGSGAVPMATSHPTSHTVIRASAR